MANRVSKWLLAVVLALTASAAFGQGVVYTNIVLAPTSTVNNSPARFESFASVRVCTEPASGSPCSPLANVYSNYTLTTPLPNPFQTDSYGNILFYAAPGTYHLQISGPGLTSYDIPYIILGNGQGTVSSINTTSPITGGPITTNGTIACPTCLTTGNLSLSSPPPIGNIAPNTITATTFASQTANHRYTVEGFPSSCTVNSVAYTTQFDCAFQTAYYIAQTTSMNQTLELGNAVYLTNVGMQQTTQWGVNILGAGAADTTGGGELGNGAGSIIKMNASISNPMLNIARMTTAYPHRVNWLLQDFTIDANHNAPMCLSFSSMRDSVIRNIGCQGATGSTTWVQAGTFTLPTDASGSNYNMVIGPIYIHQPFAAMPTVTATVSGGNIATNGYAVGSSSGYYNGPTVTAYMFGYGASSNHPNPCTTMPTGLHGTVSSGVVTSVTSSTGASGCSGNIYVYVPDLPAAAYGFSNTYTTDSTFYDILVEGVGNVAAIYDQGAPSNVWVHPHMYGQQPIGFWAGGGGVYYMPQCDDALHYCFAFEDYIINASLGGDAGTHVHDLYFEPNFGGSGIYYFGGQYLIEEEIRNTYSPGPWAANSHQYVSYAVGPITISTPNFSSYFPPSFQASGIQAYNLPLGERFDYHSDTTDQYFYGNSTFGENVAVLNGSPINGYSDSGATQTYNIAASNGSFFGTQFYTADYSNPNSGQVSTRIGDATHTGIISFLVPTTHAIAATLGYDNTPTFTLTTAGGNPFNVAGGALQVGGVTVVDQSQNATVHNLNISGTCTGCNAILTGATSTITGTVLTATCDSGTATVTGAVVGHPVSVSTTDGTDVGGAFYLRASVTSANTITVYVCGTGTPPSKSYNVLTQ